VVARVIASAAGLSDVVYVACAGHGAEQPHRPIHSHTTPSIPFDIVRVIVNIWRSGVCGKYHLLPKPGENVHVTHGKRHSSTTCRQRTRQKRWPVRTPESPRTEHIAISGRQEYRLAAQRQRVLQDRQGSPTIPFKVAHGNTSHCATVGKGEACAQTRRPSLPTSGRWARLGAMRLASLRVDEMQSRRLAKASWPGYEDELGRSKA